MGKILNFIRRKHAKPLEDLLTVVNNKIKETKCLACKQGTLYMSADYYSILGKILKNIKDLSSMENKQYSGAEFPFVTLYCDDCGYAHIYALTILLR